MIVFKNFNILPFPAQEYQFWYKSKEILFYLFLFIKQNASVYIGYLGWCTKNIGYHIKMSLQKPKQQNYFNKFSLESTSLPVKLFQLIQLFHCWSNPNNFNATPLNYFDHLH